MAESDTTTETAGVLPLVAEEGNHRLLVEWLEDHEEFRLVEAAESLSALSADVVVLDEGGLERHLDELKQLKEEAAPVLVPYLLLVPEPGMELMETEGGDLVENVLTRQIDEVVTLPMRQAELQWRIDSLLRLREQSLQARQREQRLRQYERAVEGSNDMLAATDEEYRLLFANDRYRQFFDIAGDAVRSLTLPELLGETTFETVERQFERVLGGDAVQFGSEWTAGEGETRILDVDLYPLEDAAGAVVGTVAAMRDVTEREERKRELERQVDLFEKAQDIAGIGAWEYTVESGRSYGTDEVARIHGLSPGDPLSPEDSIGYYHPEDRPEIREAFERAAEAGEPYDLELRLIDEAGDQRWVRSMGEPQYEDGDVVRVRGTIQDITDRKEQELELKQMTNAVDKAPIGVALTDPTQEDNPLMYVNDGFVEMTGYSREETLGRNCRFLQGEQTDPETVARIRRAIDANQRVSVELRNYRADGTEFWNRLAIAPVRDADGDVINYIGFQQDVTGQVEQQHQLSVLDRYLRHNIRNDMNIVQGLAEQVQAEGEQPVTEYAAGIEETADELLSDMDTEREIARLLRSEPIVERMELMSVIQAAVDAVDQRHPPANISVTGPDNVWVGGVEPLAVAFKELIGNGVVHTDADEPRVAVEVVMEGDAVVVHVSDNGSGMPEVEADVLTGSGAATAVRHGQGLGLWLVYLILRRCGGSASVIACDGDGSTVKVTLRSDDGEE